MKTPLLLIIVALIIVGTIFLVVSLLSPENYEKGKYLVDLVVPILTTLGIIPLIVTLFELRKKYRREEVDSIVAAFNFFRKEVIGLDEDLDTKSRNTNIEIPYLDKLKEGTSFTLDEIPDLPREPFQKFIDTVLKDPSLRISLINSLNALEEFSAKVLLSGYYKNDAYAPLRKPFTDMIRKYSVMLYMLKGLEENEFSNTIRLYKFWSPSVKISGMSESERGIHRSGRITEMHAKRKMEEKNLWSKVTGSIRGFYSSN